VSLAQLASVLQQPAHDVLRHLPPITSTRIKMTKNCARKHAGAVATEPTSSNAFPTIYYWQEHPAVWFAVYGGRQSLRLACSRLSVFLEDRELAGSVLPETPNACDHAAAQYTGHNVTPDGLQRFTAVVVTKPGGLTAAEKTLVNALAHAGAWARGGGKRNVVKCAGVLAIAKGLSKAESADTLVHECMHGLFYADHTLRSAVSDYWHNVLSPEHRSQWAHFLFSLGYNAKHDDELAANELLAYMCTERRLFSVGGGAPEAVCAIRDAFVASIRKVVPVPAPCVGSSGCVWQFAQTPPCSRRK